MGLSHKGSYDPWLCHGAGITLHKMENLVHGQLNFSFKSLVLTSSASVLF